MPKANGIAQGSQQNTQGLFLLCVLHQHDFADLILLYVDTGDENYGHRHLRAELDQGERRASCGASREIAVGVREVA